jgi:hypothetical protein
VASGNPLAGKTLAGVKAQQQSAFAKDSSSFIPFYAAAFLGRYP